MSVFAKKIMEQKYSHTLRDGQKESWPEIASRVTEHVLGAIGLTNTSEAYQKIEKAITERKFMPGGRYLYASGRPFHQVQNCLLLRAEDSREGWADLLQRASMALMTGAGIGVDYSNIRAEGSPISKTGGFATGPISLAGIINEAGRRIMQGGARRSAIWAGLNWKHQDIFKFIRIKDWPEEVKALKAKNFNFPADLDMTNISVLLDDEFFLAYHQINHPLHRHAQDVYWLTVNQMLTTAEPGFSVDVGINAGETLRNAPVGPDTYVLTDTGYQRVGDIVNQRVTVWTGLRWAQTEFKRTKENANVIKVLMTGGRAIVCDPEHEFILENGQRVPAGMLKPGMSLKMNELRPQVSKKLDKLAYTLGYMYGDGTFNRQYPRGEITFCTEESKKCLSHCDESIFTSVNMSDSRGFIRAYSKNDKIFCNRQKQIFPEDTFSWSHESQASMIAGLFDSDGNYFAAQNRVRLASKHRDFLVGVQRMLDVLGIRAGISTAGISTYGQSQGYMLTVCTEDVTRFSEIVPTARVSPLPCSSYREAKIKVVATEASGISDVFCCDVGYEEHSFVAEGVVISNCTEVTSRDDDDICNLGSINLARVSSLEEMRELTDLGTLFLLAGTVYSDLPYDRVGKTRQKNRRLGLGLMGIHEWLAVRGLPYAPSKDLELFLDVYAQSGEFADKWADLLGISRPVKTRACAPTGTIGIVAETTTGCEPIFAAAYQRRYLDGNVWKFQYVVDPTARRLVEMGVDPDKIEDSYSIARTPERRVSFQAWLQGYIDHGVSSTVNMPAWGTEFNNSDLVKSFGDMLIKYLPRLRGITAYPDGARGGQPLTPVDLRTALASEGEVFYEAVDMCDITKSGSCG